MFFSSHDPDTSRETSVSVPVATRCEKWSPRWIRSANGRIEGWGGGLPGSIVGRWAFLWREGGEERERGRGVVIIDGGVHTIVD